MNVLPKRQRGVALLVALLVVALAVILIAALLDRGELALARTRNALRSEQAQAYAQGLELFAAQILVATGNQHLDTNASPWALPLPPQPVPGGMISATMRDLNGCFNLNNLSAHGGNPTLWAPIFRNLLVAVGADPNLVEPVEGWLGNGGSAATDTNYYLGLPVAYRPRNNWFVHVSELRLVRGVTADVYARLAPNVCALPPPTKVNVNTATVAVLRSLGDKLSQASAEKLWNGGQANYSEPNAFAQAAMDPSVLTRLNLLGVNSAYFLARGEITLDDIPFTFYSLIARGTGATGGVRVLERSRGSDDALVAPAPVKTALAHQKAPE
ncbi:MAG: type II secretion system minor pseudopilin GspK [Dokdonella sp.]